MAFKEVELDTRRFAERLAVDTQATKIADNESEQFLRLHVEASYAVLGVAFESNPVV
jgi:hypothetical protein